MDVAARRAALSEQVLSGGGEMGALMRAHDWAATPIGPVEDWPQSLRTAVGLLLDSRYPMYIAWGPEFTQLYNDAYRPILGSKKHPAALGQSTRECFAEIWDFIGPMFERVMAHGEATFLEDQILPMDRHDYIEECYFTFCYSAVRSERGGVGGVFVTVTETTGRVLGERRLRVLRDLAAAAAAVKTPEAAYAAVAGVLATDPEDLPFALLYGRDERAGVSPLVAASGLPAGHSARIPELHASADTPWPIGPVLDGGGAVRVGDLEARFGLLDAGPWPEKPHEALVVPIAGQERPAGALVVGISARRELDGDYRSFIDLLAGQIAAVLANARAHEEERRRADSLAELDRAKTAFFSNVSHEFRTPLTLMLGPLDELLAAPDLKPEQREAVKAAQRNALRQLRLVNTLLDFSRIEAGRIRASYQAVDLGAFTADLASAFRSAIEKAGLSLELEVAPFAGPVYVDPDMWEKIVLNLVSNAFKHTFEGTIGVAVHQVGDRAELVVRDTGVGIAADHLPRIFDRFHRVKGARSRSHEGTGIGLSLVRELVRLHSGELDVESEPGRGTTFRVRVPLGSEHLPAESIGEPRVAESGIGAEPFVQEALRWLPGNALVIEDAERDALQPVPTALHAPARVLVADDNLDLREYLTRLLRPHWSVETAANGTEALEAARRTPPDLVLADIMMPGLDGFELLRALRADSRTREIPIILLSARAGEEARLEGLGAGADDYIVKPFGARELVARVGARIELARVHREAAAEQARLLTQISGDREQLAEIFDHAPAFIAVTRGPEHVFERANARYEELAGGRQLIGRSVRAAFPELVGQPYFDLLDQVYRTGVAHVGRESRIFLREGASGELREKYLNFVYQPLRAASGEVNGVFVHGVDVTELVSARHVAEEANRTKTEFLATMSHELRTPLNAIIGYVDLLRIGVPVQLPEPAVAHVGRIGSSARHLLQLIEEVLSFTGLQAGSVPIECARVGLDALLEEVRAVVEPLAQQKGIAFVVEQGDVPPDVTTDPRKLRQILLNLLGNAIKFTDRGEVRLVVDSADQHLVLDVCDTGIGIDADQMPRLFEPFWQGDQSRTRPWGGTGLGLAISQRLARLIGADISVESRAGVGTRFRLSVPLAYLPEGVSSR